MPSLLRLGAASQVAETLGGEAMYMDRSESGANLMPSRPDAPEFIKMPIPNLDASQTLTRFHPTQSKCDYQVLTDEMLAERCAYLLKRAHEDNVQFYVHCSSGHFRTGSVCSMLIGMAYELSGHHALLLYQVCVCPHRVPPLASCAALPTARIAPSAAVTPLWTASVDRGSSISERPRLTRVPPRGAPSPGAA